MIGTTGGFQEYETETGEWVKLEDVLKSIVLELNGQSHTLDRVIYIDGKIKVMAHHFPSDQRRVKRG